VFFYIILLAFFLKIAELLYLACVFLYLRVTKKKSKSISLIMPGIELILIPLLVLSSLVTDLELWWAKPLTVLALSLGITIGSYLLILIVVYFGQWNNLKQDIHLRK